MVLCPYDTPTFSARRPAVLTAGVHVRTLKPEHVLNSRGQILTI